MLIGRLPFWNIPLVKNPSFHGRARELGILGEHLEYRRDEDHNPLVACLYGLGGVGKTQIAAQYAYISHKQYDAVLWVSAETSQKLADSYGSLAHGLGIAADSVQNSDQLRDIVRRWLFTASKRDGKSVKWLLIFDNVDNVKLLERYWPSACAGAIIITSRSPDIARYYASGKGSLHVEPFSLAEAQDFITDTGSLQYNRSEGSTQQEKASAARQICQAVDNLPLALAMIKGHVGTCGMTLSRFLELHPDFDRKALFQGSLKAVDPGSYQKTINSTWTAAVTTGSPSADRKARTLMQMLAFLDGDGVPISLFAAKSSEDMLLDGPDVLEEMPGLIGLLENPFPKEFDMESAIATLLQASLISRNPENDRISCHRLVRAAIARSMDSEHKTRTFNRILFHLNSSFPRQLDGEPMHEAWKSCEELSSQVTALLEAFLWYGDELGCPMLLCEIATRAAWFLMERGQFSTSMSISKSALAICDKALECGVHPGYSSWFVRDMSSYLYNVQATVNYELRCPDNSLALHEKIQAIRETNKRPGNAEDEKWIAAARGNVAVSLLAEDRLAEALHILEEMIKREDLKGNLDHYLNNMCLCLRLMHRFDEAMDYCRLATDAIEKLRGPQSVQMAFLLFQLGSIYMIRGPDTQLSKAFDAFERCLGLQRLLRPRHPYTAFTLHKISIVKWPLGIVDDRNHCM
ncbi:MAG: hypothetical protein M1820_001830 [Bogoriella megaspora]|nr:MAG: hypothetical protein M1820_001830 [Bogoriella megaspora]